MYCDQSSKFKRNVFKHFNGLVECIDDTHKFEYEGYWFGFWIGGKIFGQCEQTMPLLIFLL
jgi:hypothetical protein